MAKNVGIREHREKACYKHILQHITGEKNPIYKHTEESFSIFAVLQIDNKPLKKHSM